MLLVRRCLVAAASALLAALAVNAFPADDLCVGAGCMLVGLFVAPLIVLGAALLAYALMALGRVRPAWPVALAGPITLLAVVTTVDVGTFPVFAAAAAACYAYAALVTADGLPNAWRVALGSPVVVLFAWGVVWPIVR
ncbi:hypothetical protein SAMN05421837_103965 [Amycolatopsis pretoriensis]|uniref:Uncharacterized protein n=1 Tax=Amycolatopsis pretoriensis TaxID=218821 RepID=A0A1H5QNI7_9PSEU|nr:hypothetical protein [Amycolatopsis pretoriensis]SEF27625.1 hypothetical protein SAMN05421837_103965 [Amycolatopsis pretoriensis]